MGQRFVIRHGDGTTKHGTVTAYRSHTLNGRAVACEGDRVICRTCGTTGRIACAGKRVTNTIDGREVALTGDLCLCQCNPAPLLIQSQTLATCA